MPENFAEEAKKRVRIRQEQRRLTQEAYSAFLDEVSRILYQHDFLGLADAGFPEDEYAPDAGTIIRQRTSSSHVAIVKLMARRYHLRRR